MTTPEPTMQDNRSAVPAHPALLRSLWRQLREAEEHVARLRAEVTHLGARLAEQREARRGD